MVFGPILFVLLAVLAIILLVIGLTTFLWLPLLVIGGVGILWLPVAGWLRAQTAGSGGGSSGDPTGVPTTSEASYDPVQQPQDQSHG